MEKAERVYCQTVNTCIDFKTKWALEAYVNDSRASGWGSFLRLSHARSRRAGGATEALLTLPCFLRCGFVLWRPATQERKEEEGSKQEVETEEKEREKLTTTNVDKKIFPETQCQVY